MYYTSITKYYEYSHNSTKYTHSRADIETDICDDKNTTFEVLRNNYMRIFLDIENVPITITSSIEGVMGEQLLNHIDVNDDSIMQSIVRDFITFADLRSDIGYVVTKNIGSHHLGLSYHVIFSVATLRDNLKNLVMNFKKEYPQYNDYVDHSIYTRNRLFRLPEQKGLPQRTKDIDALEPDMINKLTFDANIKKWLNTTDVHHIHIVTGRALTDDPYEIDYLIQNINACVCYDKVWLPIDNGPKVNDVVFSRNHYNNKPLSTLGSMFKYVVKYFTRK